MPSKAEPAATAADDEIPATAVASTLPAIDGVEIPPRLLEPLAPPPPSRNATVIAPVINEAGILPAGIAAGGLPRRRVILPPLSSR
jgi:hypothetical protein